MKRIAMLLLTLAMLFSLIACGLKDTQPADAADTPPAEQPASDAAANEPQPAPAADPQSEETAAPPAGTSDDKQQETKTDAAQKDEQKPETSQKTEEKQTAQTPADTTPETKSEAPGCSNGGLTVSQIREMQRWYGVSVDGQWGDGSARAAGGRTAEEAWTYYQQNRNAAPEETEKPDNGAAGGTAATPAEPAKPAKADIDCDAAMKTANAYAESLGFMIWDGAKGYYPPVYLEEDFPSSQWTRATVNKIFRDGIDFLVGQLEKATGEKPSDAPYGSYAANCVIYWNASENRHEIYICY